MKFLSVQYMATGGATTEGTNHFRLGLDKHDDDHIAVDMARSSGCPSAMSANDDIFPKGIQKRLAIEETPKSLSLDRQMIRGHDRRTSRNCSQIVWILASSLSFLLESEKTSVQKWRYMEGVCLTSSHVEKAKERET